MMGGGLERGYLDIWYLIFLGGVWYLIIDFFGVYKYLISDFLSKLDIWFFSNASYLHVFYFFRGSDIWYLIFLGGLISDIWSRSTHPCNVIGPSHLKSWSKVQIAIIREVEIIGLTKKNFAFKIQCMWFSEWIKVFTYMHDDNITSNPIGTQDRGLATAPPPPSCMSCHMFQNTFTLR